MQLRALDIRLSYVGPVYTLSDTCNNAIVVAEWNTGASRHVMREEATC